LDGIEWQGDNPCALVIEHDGNVTIIDLDQRGWSETYRELMRKPSLWYLVVKEDSHIPIAIKVVEGEQPYYTARHIGIASGVPGPDGRMPANEVIAYGLGKKRLDGHVDRLWWFSNGLVVSGEDAEAFGIKLIKEGHVR